MGQLFGMMGASEPTAQDCGPAVIDLTRSGRKMRTLAACKCTNLDAF